MGRKGKGWYVRNGIIYIQATVDGKRYRISTGKKANKQNISYIERNYYKVLSQLVDKIKEPKQIKQNFKEFAYKILDATSLNRSENTQKDLISKLEYYILPYFGNFSICEIKPFHIESWQTKIAKDKSHDMAKRCKKLLKYILKRAVDNELISKNPTDSTSIIKVKTKEKEPYSKDEINKILNSAEGWFKNFLVVMYGTGIRVSEALVLKWDDVSFSENTLFIRRSMYKSTIKETTKTGKIAKIGMSYQVKEALLHQLKYKTNDWIFPNKYGKPFTDTKNIIKYHFKPVLQKAGVKYKGLGILRHTFTSILLNNGTDIMMVQNMLRHTTGVTTLKHYSKFYGINKEKLDFMDKILFHNDTNMAHMKNVGIKNAYNQGKINKREIDS